MFLASQLEDLMDDAKDALGAFSVARTADAQIAALESAATRCTLLGLAALLVDADRERFRRQLTYAGYARRWFHAHLAARVPADHPARARSRWPSFYAALAVGDAALARQLAVAEPVARVATGEYAEEFGVAHALAEALVAASLESTRKALAEHAPEVAEVLEAIEAADVARVQAGIAGFLVAEGEARASAPPTSDEVEDELGRRISLVGLALVQLARARGVPLPPLDHARAPRLATELPAAAQPDDIIAELRV